MPSLPKSMLTSAGSASIQTKPVRQTADWNYQVEQVRLLTPTGEETRFFGNRRVDTGEVLGVVSEKYNLLQNSELFGATEKLVSEFSSNSKVKYMSTNGGAKVFAQYILPTIGFKLGKDDIVFRLGIQNSFDGSLRVSMQVGLFRLICLNGATAPIKGSTANLDVKHTGALDVSFAKNALENSIARFQSMREVLHPMSTTRISQQGGHKILNGLIIHKAISEHQADKVREIWDAPTHHEDRERNVYNLWNATTQHLTHSVSESRFEMADRYSRDVTQLLATHSARGTIDDLAMELPTKQKLN